MTNGASGDRQRFSRYALMAVRIVVPILLVAWIARRVLREDPQRMAELAELDKNYRLLLLAVAAYLAAMLITFGRWFLLVRALKIPFRLADAVRLGFVGYFMQFLSLGTVGGDLFKAVFIAREQPRKKAEAVATVFVDRAVGFFALLIVTCMAFIRFGWTRLNEELHFVAITCLVVTCIATGIVMLLLFTQFTLAPLRRLFRNVPAIAAGLLRGEHALHLYRSHKSYFMVALASGLVSHCLLAASAYFAATAIYANAPSFSEQLIIWNIAGAIATLPVSPGGLGTLEAAYSALYEFVPIGGRPLADGLTVAILLRVISVVVAAIGVVIYWFSRREMQDVMHAAAEDSQLPSDLLTSQSASS